MRVLISGVAGFIGSHLAGELLARGHRVYGIDNLSTGREENIPAGVEWTPGDIRDLDQMRPLPWDVIYHCAAGYRDRDDWEGDASTNVLGTINVVREAQRSGARLIYFQTSLCYGLDPESPVSPWAPLAPHGSYAVSKTAGESYIRDSGVPWVSLRLANIYGPRNLSGPVPAFYKRLAGREPCTVVDTRRDFVFVGDLVRAALAVLEHGEGVWHVGSGRDHSIAEVHREVARAMGVEPGIVTETARGADDAATILLDVSRTVAGLRWEATTTLREGIEAAVVWYREHGVGETYTHLAVKG